MTQVFAVDNSFYSAPTGTMPATRQASRSSKGNLNPKSPGKLGGKSKSPASRAGGNQRRAAAAPNSQTPDGIGASGGIADALDLENLGRPSGTAPKGPIPLSPLVQGAPGRPAVPNPLADQDGRYAREGPRLDRHADADGSPDANAGDKAPSDGPLRVNVPEEPAQPVETAPAATLGTL